MFPEFRKSPALHCVPQGESASQILNYLWIADRKTIHYCLIVNKIPVISTFEPSRTGLHRYLGAVNFANRCTFYDLCLYVHANQSISFSVASITPPKALMSLVYRPASFLLESALFPFDAFFSSASAFFRNSLHEVRMGFIQGSLREG